MCINIESCQPGTPTTKYGTTGNQLTKNDHSFPTPLPAQSVRDYLIRHTAMSLQFKSKPLRPLPLPLFPLCPLPDVPCQQHLSPCRIIDVLVTTLVIGAKCVVIILCALISERGKLPPAYRRMRLLALADVWLRSKPQPRHQDHQRLSFLVATTWRWGAVRRRPGAGAQEMVQDQRGTGPTRMRPRVFDTASTLEAITARLL